MQRNSLAIMFALVAVLMWSTVATAFKLSLQWLSILQLLAGACFFSTLVLAVCLALRKELAFSCKDLLKNYKLALLMGVLNPIVYYIILLKAYSLLPAQVAQSINYTWAISLMLLSVPILGHKISKTDSIGVALSYMGVVFISFGGKSITGEIDLFGIVLALLSTLIWALYWLISTKDKRPPITKLFQSFIVALPILFVMAYVVDGVPSVLTWQPLAAIAYVGFFEMGLAFICWQMALFFTDKVSRISSLIFLSPFISLFIIHNVLDEHVTTLTLCGLCLVVVGVLFQQYYSNKKKEI